MPKSRQLTSSLENSLGFLAMEFRGTKDEVRRNELTLTYAQVVRRLIESGKWTTMPSFEDMLPDERMPASFYVFWSIASPNGSTPDPRMNPTILLEGSEDVTILRKVLPPRVLDSCHLRPVQGKRNMVKEARTHIASHQAPVALLFDADTLDKGVIRKSVADMRQDVAAVAGNIPFGVYCFVPEIEGVLLRGSIDFRRVFPAYRTVFDRQLARTAPKEQLNALLAKGQGPTTLSDFLDHLKSDEVESLRYQAPIPQLIAFVANHLDSAKAA